MRLLIVFLLNLLLIGQVISYRNKVVQPTSQTDKKKLASINQPPRKNNTVAEGSLLSNVALIAGTTVGAGILALPQTTAKSGVFPSSIALFGAWIVMAFSGLLIAEVTLNFARKKNDDISNLGLISISKQTLGESSSYISGFLYIFLHYALLVAYIVGGGKIINETMHLSTPIGPIAFATIFGGILAFSTEKLIDKINSTFAAIVLVSFVCLLSFGAPLIKFDNIIYQDFSAVWKTIPIMFLSLVYHNVVPVVCKNLNFNTQAIRQSIILGSFIPLLMFLTWNFVILGIVDHSLAIGGNFDPLDLLRRGTSSSTSTNSDGSSGKILSILLNVFSEGAIITSFIGFVFGLLDFFRDIWPQFGKRDIRLLALVILPALAISLISPNIFIQALDLAGTFGVTSLFVLLPIAMAWVTRYGSIPKNVPDYTQGTPGKSKATVVPIETDEVVTDEEPIRLVPGGKTALVLMLLGSATIVFEKLLRQ